MDYFVEDQQHDFGEKNRLCDDISDGSHKSRSNFTGALRKVREKLYTHRSSSSKCSSPTFSSSSMHRSNTTPIPFSMTNPSNDQNIVRDKEERTTDVRQKSHEGTVLTKLRKQAKIMDVMGRKSHGSVCKNRKSDGQHLLLSEEGYCSGLE